MPGTWKRRPDGIKTPENPENPFKVLLTGALVALLVLFLAVLFRRPVGAKAPDSWRGAPAPPFSWGAGRGGEL